MNLILQRRLQVIKQGLFFSQRPIIGGLYHRIDRQARTKHERLHVQAREHTWGKVELELIFLG